MSTDRNLLFGVLALQMGIISRDALIAGMNAWVLDKSRSLGDVLQEEGALSAEDHAMVKVIVKRHLQMHGNDPQQSLAAVPLNDSTRAELSAISDEAVQGSLHSAYGKTPGSEQPTASYSPSAGSEGRYKVLRPHAKGGWARCSSLRTWNCTGRSRSRRSRNVMPAIPAVAAASSSKRRSRAGWSTPAWCRFMGWGSTPTAVRSM